MNRLVILDGNALLHRAFHAIPPLTAPDGQIVGAVYGFLSMVIRLQNDLAATHMAVAFDRPKPTFRNELYPQYQAQRPPMDISLVSQIGLTHEAVEAFDIPIFEQDGFEADDVIGTITHTLMSSPQSSIEQVIIVTGDRDILQLVKDNQVLVYMPVKGLSEAKLYGENEVFERLSVKPNQITDWKALCGDPSDNYPGVAGIGPKTASDLIATYQTIENLYRQIESGQAKLSARVLEKLIAGKESAFLSKDLATIRCNAVVDVKVDQLRIGSFQSEAVVNILQRFGFSSLLKRIEKRVIPVDKSISAKKKPSAHEQMNLI